MSIYKADRQSLATSIFADAHLRVSVQSEEPTGLVETIDAVIDFENLGGPPKGI